MIKKVSGQWSVVREEGAGHVCLSSVICLIIFYLLFVTVSDAKVYIDITSPASRKLPVLISYSGHGEAKEILEIIKSDLDFTGLFNFIEHGAPGAEITIKMDIDVSAEIKTEVVVIDLVENREVLSKRYRSSKSILRTFSHTISNDIFKTVTGREGIFRTKLSYVAKSSNKKELYLMDWDGHNQIKAVSKGLTLSHSWSPDGQYIVYSSERNRVWGIYLQDLINYKEYMLSSVNGLNIVGGISPDGRRIAFSSSRDGNPEIYTMNMYGSDLKKLTRSTGIDVSPSFSPDGSQIVFVSDRGGTPQLYIMNTDGTGLSRLTFEGSYNTSPTWSPNGKWIAYVGRGNDKNQIFMIKSDGTDLRQLTTEGNNENPTFSPDGMFIAFDSDRDNTKGIYLMNISDGRVKRITPKNIEAMSPKWSPYIK